jgi:hypothetical protein
MILVVIWALGGFIWAHTAFLDYFMASRLQFFLDVIICGGSFGMANFYLRKWRGLI